MGLQAGHRQESPLVARYWSEVPYASGPAESAVCRYSAIPHDGNFGAVMPEDRARPGLPARGHGSAPDPSTARAARFDFAVQVREDATSAVIDDPTVAWDAP